MKNTHIDTIDNTINFAKNLHNNIFDDLLITNNKTDIDNRINDYYLNNQNFRDKKEWVDGDPAEILALGCSNTYGLGIPQEYNWPSIIESKTRKTVANLGICGASAESNLNSFLLYLDRVGKPKYVMACFADYLRYSHIVDGKFYNFEGPEARKVVSFLRTADYITGEINVNSKIIKLPGDARDLIPAQESLHQYISSIYIIEKICKFLDIKFYWGTWSETTQNIFTKNLFLEEEFYLDKNNNIGNIPLSIMTKKNSNYPSCHKEDQDLVINLIDKIDISKHEGGMWFVGSDGSHLGIHSHYHIAESFIEKIEGNK
jgi:hypothetical protein